MCLKTILLRTGSMIKPPIPASERERLEALRTLKILDTPAEERFDRVTRLAQRAFGVPIALFSIVDEGRQWFKSRQGLDAEETSREISFCGHTILKEEVMVVPDATGDERFHDNPLVTCDPNIRFYAGCPISAPDGSRIGTLCVIDRESRDFSDDDVDLLKELASMIEEELVSECLLTTDPLTGLSNLRGLEVAAEHLLPLCQRTNTPVSLLLFRLDTEYGMRLDERRAVTFANLLNDTFRESDIIARVADDIFAVVLAGADLQMAGAMQRRLGQMLNEHNQAQLGDAELVLETAQVGFLPSRHDDVMSLINDAQWQLYEMSQGIASA